jgi:hypothetical protein
MDKKTAAGVIAAISLFATLYGISINGVEAVGAIVVDTPYSDVASTHSRIDLFAGRPIVAVVTPSTHPDNVAFLQNYPTVIKIIELPDNFDEKDIFKEIKQNDVLIYARPELKEDVKRKIR